VQARWWSALLAAPLIGAGIGAAVAAGGQTDSTAEAKVVVQAKGGPTAVRPLLPNVRELATSSLLAGNVDSTLRLPGSADGLRRRLHATVAPGSQVIVLSVADANGDRARQIAQEAAVVLTQLVQNRFRMPQLQATVLDPAHVVSHRGRHFLRDALIGAAIGLALATAVLLATRRGIAAPGVTDERLAERERQLKERIDLITRRERETAKRAGELAKRERDVATQEARAVAELAKRERAVATQEAQAVAAGAAAPAVEAPPLPVTEPARAPQPSPAPQPLPASAGKTSLPTLDTLEHLVRERASDFPERAEEWADYLFYLREHAGPDGRLSANFSGLVHDVFGELLQ
jgi:hypothetical protein